MTLVALAGVGAFAQTAGAAVGDSFRDACINAGAAQSPCGAAAGQTGAYREAISPDGKQLYLAVGGGTPPGGGAAESAAILIYDRDPSTGHLTRRTDLGCVTPTGSSGGCVQAANLSNPQDIVISRDGTSLYVSDAGSNTIMEFARASGGGLTLMSQCQGAATACDTVTGIGQPHALGLSPDGKSLYLRSTQGSGKGTLLVFDRASNGTLTQKTAPNGCWAETAQTGCSLAAGLSEQSWQIAVTDTNVYAVGRMESYYLWYDSCPPYGCWAPYYLVPSSGSIAIFGRAADGSLSQAAAPNGCISNNGYSGGNSTFPGTMPPVRCVDGSDGLDLARGVTISPDGNSVYVAGVRGIVSYSRGANGALTGAGCLEQAGAGLTGCTEAAGLGDDYRMAVSPDGKAVLATAAATGGVVFLNRNTSTGVLSERAGTKRCVTHDGSGGACETLAPLGGLGDVAVSPDSTFEYLVSQTNGMLATFHVDAAPTCQEQSVAVPYQTSVSIPLTCTDKNGDQLALSITRQPMQGFLGGGGSIDPSSNTIRYSPPLAYSGADSFEFTATGQGVESAPATVSLNVGSAPPADPQPSTTSGPAATPAPTPPLATSVAKAPGLPSTVSATWRVAKAKFILRHLKLGGLRPGWKASVACSGKHCPFKRMAIVNKTLKRGGFDAIKMLRKHTRFAAGQTLTVTLSAPRFRTKVVTFRLKQGKRPRAASSFRG